MKVTITGKELLKQLKWFLYEATCIGACAVLQVSQNGPQKCQLHCQGRCMVCGGNHYKNDCTSSYLKGVFTVVGHTHAQLTQKIVL